MTTTLINALRVSFLLAVNHGRNVGRGAGCFDPSAQPVGIVGLVGEDDSILSEATQELAGDGTIPGLAGCQHQLERQAPTIGEGVDLGRQSAPRAAHTAIRVAFFEFAAC